MSVPGHRVLRVLHLHQRDAMVTQSVRLPDALAAQLSKLAKTTRRSKSSHLIEALENYLEAQKDLQVALERFRDPEAQWVDHDEVRRELDLD